MPLHAIPKFKIINGSLGHRRMYMRCCEKNCKAGLRYIKNSEDYY